MTTIEAVNIVPIAATASGRLSESEQAILWADLVEQSLSGSYESRLSLVEKTNARSDLDAASATRFAELLEEHLGIDVYLAKVSYFAKRSAELQPDGVFWQELAASNPADHEIQRLLEDSRKYAVAAFAGSFVDALKNAICDLEIVRKDPGEFFTGLRVFIASR